MEKCFVIGGGITGLAAGLASGYDVLEESNMPGGICSSYYVQPYDTKQLASPPKDLEAYRFEKGGGHWIFGGDQSIRAFLDNLSPLERYQRKSSVYFCSNHKYVPFPIQNHLAYLDKSIASEIVQEIICGSKYSGIQSMKDWMESNFGNILTKLFFGPFNRLYTAELWDRVIPQDGYKSPIEISAVIQGAINCANPVGYNTTFAYPKLGLDHLIRNFASKVQIQYEKKVASIDLTEKVIYFNDGSAENFNKIISTISLSNLWKMANIGERPQPDPYTSVLVLNIGAVKGDRCPDDHWLYNPDAKSKFHRVGFYSNVDSSFLPYSARLNNDKVSIYVERAFLPEQKPDYKQIGEYSREVINELQQWGFIKDVEVVDNNWVEVAYTWSAIANDWKSHALNVFSKNNIFCVGRYGRWQFQGVADSIRDGFVVGNAVKTLN